MPNKFLIFISILSVFLVSCLQNNENKQDVNEHSPRQSMNIKQQQQLIYDLEQKLRKDNSGVFDQNQALSIVNLYSNYIKNFPDDTVYTPEYLFKMAQIQITLKQGKSAVENLDKLMVRFPQCKYAANACFLKAFTYDNVLKDSEKAIAQYKIFIDKYPNHDLARSAKASLNVAGKSEEDLLKMIHSKKQ